MKPFLNLKSVQQFIYVLIILYLIGTLFKFLLKYSIKGIKLNKFLVYRYGNVRAFKSYKL